MKRRLSAFDAFFVAYQETSGVLMQLGVEVELKGQLARSDLESMLLRVVRRWPPLGQQLRRGVFGLSWNGESRVSEMLCVAEGREALNEWRNRPLDPFQAEDHLSHALAGQAKLPPDPVGDLFEGGPFCSNEFAGDPETRGS
jgi:hypothetical protein